MTPYELMDLRGSISDTYMSTLRLWLTVTFACFGAGNFASSSLSIFTFILLFVFYGCTSIGMGVYIIQLRKELYAVEKDVVSIMPDNEITLNIIAYKTIRSRNTTVNLQWVIVFFAPIMFGIYLYSQYTFN